MRRLAAALAAALVVAASAGLANPSEAAAEPAAGEQPAITLRSIPSWVATGADFTIGVTLAPDVDRVVVSAYNNVNSRSALEKAFDGRALTSPSSKVTLPIAVSPASAAGVTLPVGLQATDAPRDDNRLQLRRTGVYPLRIEARRGDTPVGEVVTQLVVVDLSTPAVGSRLALAMVWPLATPPAIAADGNPDPAVTAQWRPDGRVGRLVGALNDHPAVPVTLTPSPEMLESWSALAADDGELANTFATLRSQLAAPRQVLPGAYVPIDLPSLLANDLGTEVPKQFAAGADAYSDVTATRVTARTAAINPTDTAALDAIRIAGIERVVVNSAALKPVEERFTNAAPFALDAGGRRFTALASNDALVDLLGGTDAPAVRAQRFLAWCTVVALEQPNVKRGLAAAMPLGWDVPRELADAVLAGVTFNPIIEPTTIDAAFDALTAKNPPVRSLQPIIPARPAVSSAEVRATNNNIDAFASLVGPDDPAVARNRRQVLAAMTAFWTNDQIRARAELGAVDASIAAFVANVQTPGNRTVTITARKARLPVAVLNNTGRPLRVRITAKSDKLFFPQGSQQTVDLPPRASTVNFVVETRASGTFPMQVDVASADGRLDVTSSKLTVRSTVVSGVGVFLTVGAAVFLAAWWATHYRKTRRVRPTITP